MSDLSITPDRDGDDEVVDLDEDDLEARLTNPNLPRFCCVSSPRIKVHVEYMVTFGFNDGSRRCTWKRYSDFLALYNGLTKSHNPNSKEFKNVEFPRKRVTSHKKESVMDDRCRKLDSFLLVVLRVQPQALSAWSSEAATLNAEESSLLASYSPIVSPSPVKSLNNDFNEHTEAEIPPETDEIVKDRANSLSSILRIRNGSFSSDIASPLMSLDQQSPGVVGRMMNVASKRYSEEYMKKEVAAAESRAREKATRDTTAHLHQRHQLEIEAFAAREMRLQKELDSATEKLHRYIEEAHAKQTEWDIERSNFESSLAVSRKALAAFAAQHQYIKATRSLRVKINHWEKDGRDKHVRFLIEIKSELTHDVNHGQHEGFSQEARYGIEADVDTLRNDESNSHVQARKTNTSAIGIDTLVRHRYSDFLHLARALKCPPESLPPKLYFPSSRKALKERAKALEIFMNDTVLARYSLDWTMVADGVERQPLRDFMGLVPPPQLSTAHIAAALGAYNEFSLLQNQSDVPQKLVSIAQKKSTIVHASSASSDDILADARAAASASSNGGSKNPNPKLRNWEENVAGPVKAQDEGEDELIDQLGELRLGSALLESEGRSEGDGVDGRLSTMTTIV